MLLALCICRIESTWCMLISILLPCSHGIRKFPQWKFNVYFVAPVDSSKPTKEERWRHCMTTPGCEFLLLLLL